MPFSKYCRAENVYSKHFSWGSERSGQTYHCDEREYRLNYSGWPTNIINIEIPSNNGKACFPSYCSVFSSLIHVYPLYSGFTAYPSATSVAQPNFSTMECGLPTQLSFSAREISDGTFFKAIEDYDPDSKRLLYQLKKCVYLLRTNRMNFLHVFF